MCPFYKPVVAIWRRPVSKEDLLKHTNSKIKVALDIIPCFPLPLRMVPPNTLGIFAQVMTMGKKQILARAIGIHTFFRHNLTTKGLKKL